MSAGCIQPGCNPWGRILGVRGRTSGGDSFRMPKATHCRAAAFELFRAQMPIIETTRGLLRAAVAISLHHLDEIAIEQVEGVIDTYGRDILKRVRRPENADAVLAHLHDQLFEQAGFCGNSEDYYSPLNSYVPMVLQNKRGLPITLSLVYKAIAERVGLKVIGINAPLHFMAGVVLDEEAGKVMLVDPFFSGRVLSKAEAFDRIEQVSGRAVPRVDEMLPAATHRQWIGRILHNLMNVFEHHEQRDDHRAMVELRGVLMTEA